MPFTYEALFELVMREKGREELQKLDPKVYSDILTYLEHKKRVAQSTLDGAFSSGDHTLQQLRNIRRLVRELYERREKKIINLAIIRSRTGSEAMDLSSMLDSEKNLFMALVEKLDNTRSEVTGTILSEKKTEKPEPPESPTKEPEKNKGKVRFLKEVPKFIGKELEVYGPFNEGDTVELPKELADVLVVREKATYV